MNQLWQLIQQMQGMGFSPYQTSGSSSLAGLTGSDIQSVIESTYDIPEGIELDPEMFGTFDLSALAGGLQKTYSPRMDLATSSTSRDLESAISGKLGKKAIGSFAGSGQWGDYLTSARDVYGQKVGEILSEIERDKYIWGEGVGELLEGWTDVGETYSAPT
jgi:hypothetical protein